MTPLCELALKYRTDKCPQLNHNYTPKYHELLHERRLQVKKVLEIGIGFPETMPVAEYRVGASLRMWREYFPQATIFAVDKRADILVNEERIQSFVCDQSQSGMLHALVDRIGGDFDLIVDDGSHKADHQIISAVALVPFLAPGGLYVVEDIQEPLRILHALSSWGWDPRLFEFNRAAQDDRLIVVTRSS